jgi:carbonic anhydrase
LLYRIEPAVVGVSPDLNHEALVAAAVVNNVRLAVRRLSRVPGLMKSMKQGNLRIVGAVYSMHSGKVRFLDRP